MGRPLGDLFGYVVLSIVVLGLLGFFGFTLVFGAADHTEVTFRAQQLSADGIVDDSTYDPPTHIQPIVDKTIENGSSRTTALAYDPFFENAPAHQVHSHGTRDFIYVEHDDTFYRIAVSNIDEVEAQRQTLDLVRVNETQGEVIEYEDLPTVDKRAVGVVATLDLRGCDDFSYPNAPRCWTSYSTQDATESILVPTPPADYVRYENQTFELVIRERTTNVTAITYRATSVTNDSASFRAQFVTAVSEDDLTNGERKLLQRAIDEGYNINVYRHDLKQIPRERFDSLLPKLGLPTLDELSRGHHGASVGYIDYRGKYYRVKIEYSDTYA